MKGVRSCCACNQSTLKGREPRPHHSTEPTTPRRRCRGERGDGCAAQRAGDAPRGVQQLPEGAGHAAGAGEVLGGTGPHRGAVHTGGTYEGPPGKLHPLQRLLEVVVEQGCTPVAREVTTGTAHLLSVRANGSPLLFCTPLAREVATGVSHPLSVHADGSTLLFCTPLAREVATGVSHPLSVHADGSTLLFFTPLAREVAIPPALSAR